MKLAVGSNIWKVQIKISALAHEPAGGPTWQTYLVGGGDAGSAATRALRVAHKAWGRRRMRIESITLIGSLDA